MKSWSTAIGGALLLLVCGQAGATDNMKVIAQDVRTLGDGRCVLSIAVRFNEPIESPWLPQARLIKTSRKTVECSRAPTATDQMIRDAESNLLMRALIRSDSDNGQIRSVTLHSPADVYADAMSESRLVKVLPVGTQLYMRSVTPLWFAITDAHGVPKTGFVHYAELSGPPARPSPILTAMTVACGSRLRSAPDVDAPILTTLKCGESVNVTARPGGWYEVVSSQGVASGSYINGVVLKSIKAPRPRSRRQQVAAR